MEELTKKTAVKDDSSERRVRELTLCGMGGAVGGSDDVIGGAAVLCADELDGTELMKVLVQQFMVQQQQQHQLFLQCVRQGRQDRLEHRAWMRRNAPDDFAYGDDDDFCDDDVTGSGDSLRLKGEQAVVGSVQHQLVEWNSDFVQVQPAEDLSDISKLYFCNINYANVCIVHNECDSVSGCVTSVVCEDVLNEPSCIVNDEDVNQCVSMSVSHEDCNSVNNLCTIIVSDQCVESVTSVTDVCNKVTNGDECISGVLCSGSVPIVIVGMLHTGKSVVVRSRVSVLFVFVQCAVTVVCVWYSSVYRSRRHVYCFVLICVKLYTMVVLLCKLCFGYYFG